MKKILLVPAVVICMISCQKVTPSTETASTLSPNTSVEPAEAAENEVGERQGPQMDLVFHDNLYQLTGVAVDCHGRKFTNYPLWPGPYKNALVEITGQNTSVPYPDAYWNSWHQGEDGNNKWVCVQAVHIDDRNTMWVVDPASPLMEGVYQHSYKLVKINLHTNAVERIYKFNYVADNNSYINDVRIDTEKGFAYLTNSSEGGLVIVNLDNGNMRQVLQGNSSVISDPSYHLTFHGIELKTDYGQPVKFNSDGIALTPDRKYIYYKPLSDDRLFRIQTKYLRNFDLSQTESASKVEFLGHFTVTDGMILDEQDNLYLGDVQHYRIMKITPDLQMSVFVKDRKLIWPDSYSIAGGYLYVSCSQIQKQPEYNLSNHLPNTDYTIYRIAL